MELQPRSLDEWYKKINRLYLDRNFYRDPESIYTHLVEIVGGLSLLASGKTKPGVDPQRHIAKALAWWLTLCGKMRIRSVEDMLWSKYPNICPYCRLNPHDNTKCQKIKRLEGNPNWELVQQIGKTNIGEKPKTLGEWFVMFNTIYPAQQSEDYYNTFARFTEEMGELAEAVRLFQLAPGYFFSEASDFFAWLMHLQALLFLKKDLWDNVSTEFENVMQSEYPGACPDCGKELCECPPILKRTFGRIAHDMPIIVEGDGNNPLLSLTEAFDLFQMSSKSIKVGETELDVTTEMLGNLKEMITSLQDEIYKLEGITDQQTKNILEVIQKTDSMLDSERVTQESIDSLVESISHMPSESRSFILSWLGSFSSSLLATGIIQAVNLIIPTLK